MDARRLRSIFSVLLLGNDALMLALGFAVAHRLRLLIPWPRESTNVDRLLSYVPVILLFVGANIFVFFLFRLYHLVRATSRVDEFYTVVGGVTVGTLLMVALASLTLKNTVFAVDLSRAMVAYAW